jgi:hypothetical protein
MVVPIFDAQKPLYGYISTFWVHQEDRNGSLSTYPTFQVDRVRNQAL